MGRSPPQGEINATRPVMSKVEHALETQCSLVGLALHVTEQCWKEDCGPMYSMKAAVSKESSDALRPTLTVVAWVEVLEL